ncbi:MAG: DUF1588 domain-containing protein [Alphaproteobacteria bacterium]|nr:DUF1588 domain-containing protein [Alphaproteobacteria bacterium]
MVALTLLLACAGPETTPQERVSVLTRASLDLTGARPDLADLEAVRDDPEALEPLLDALVDREGFGEALLRLHAPLWGTRATRDDIDGSNLAIADEEGFLTSLGEEPLRILAEVAEQDLPYPTLFTADWTVLDERLAPWHPAAYPDDGLGWLRSMNTDGRPAAGVLASSGLWWRYQTTDSNANRGRANWISKVFLCNDTLERLILVEDEPDLVDEATTLDAIRHHPGCVSCHQALDPIGATLWGFDVQELLSPVGLTFYAPSRESTWLESGVYGQAWFGTPVDGLAQLSRVMAADPGVIECAVQTGFELLLQREATAADTETLTRHREAFLDADLTLRGLYRSLLDDPAYRDFSDDAELKLVSDAQLFGQIEGLTGYRFTVGSRDPLRHDSFGLRSALAASRTFDINQLRTITPMTAVARERLAAVASAAVAEADHGAAQPLLFSRVDFSETPITSESLMRQQLVDLHLQVLGQVVEADSAEVDETLALWSELFAAAGDTELAWAGVLEVLMRDVDFLAY